MKNKSTFIAVLALCISLKPSIVLTNLPVAKEQALRDDQGETAPASDSSAHIDLDTCSALASYVLPTIGSAISIVFASGVFLLLELRWNLRE